jgi:hypothetical protein
VAEREGFELTLRFGVDLTHIESKSVSDSSQWLTSTGASGSGWTRNRLTNAKALSWALL